MAARDRPLSDEALELMAERFRLLSDATRLKVLHALAGGEKSVGEVVRDTGAGQANVSKHLALLARSGVLRRRKDGLRVYYRVTDPWVLELCDYVCSTLGEELARRSENAQFSLNSPHGGRETASRSAAPGCAAD
ncbi:MAG: ArsR/SmtB family transcription factor [Chloroflexota bacterium]